MIGRAILVVVCAAGVSLAQEPAPAQLVEMTASDGKAITGKLYGQSETALVLCHGRRYTTGAASFADECRDLQAKGIMCLAISFRGYPSDSPPMLRGQELDVVAAVDALVERGAKNVYVLGSSMGGFAALDALKALSAKPQFRGVVILSAFQSQGRVTASCRKLFVVAEDDRRLWPKVMAMFRKAAAPKQAIVFRTGGHGQQLFETRRDELMAEILTFLR